MYDQCLTSVVDHPADAIMGVSFFRESAPQDFATFDLSFYAMSVLTSF